MVPRAEENLNGPCDERTPTVGTLANGQLVVAYLYQMERGQGWDLRVAPIEFVGDQRVPRVEER